MIYDSPGADAPVDQGDVIDGCPINLVRSLAPDLVSAPLIDFDFRRVLVLTQTCDLSNQKATFANVAEAFDAQSLVEQKLFKPADVKGPLCAGRIWGWYFLPGDANLGLAEMIVDLRRLHTVLHTVRLAVLVELCRAGKRRGRLQPLYREHLAKHFADTFSRIGLPRPYETL